MSVKSGETIVVDFTTHDATGALTDADALPAGTLVIDGTDNAATVTVTNKATGRYKASVAIPSAQTTGKKIALHIAATIDAVACGGIVWQDTIDAKHVGDLNDAAAAPSAASIRAEIDSNSTQLATLVARLTATRAGYLDSIPALALAADLTAAQADLATLLGRLSATRAGYLDKLNVSGLVASAADVAAITQAQRVRIVAPAMLERPDVGSTTYRVWIYAYNELHEAEALDASPTVTAENNLGTDRSANLSAVANPSTGVYYADYTVASGHAIEGLVLKVAATEGGVTTGYATAALIVDTTAVDFTSADRAKLDELHDNRLTSARAAALDRIPTDPADQSDVEAAISAAAATVLAAVAALENLSAAEAQAAAAAALASYDPPTNAEMEARTIPAASYAAAADLATALARLGPWTGTGLNTVLGALRALAAKAAALTPADIATGTTFDNTTDSLEAQKDAGGAAGASMATAVPETPTAGTMGEALAAALHWRLGKRVLVDNGDGTYTLRTYRAHAVEFTEDTLWHEEVLDHPTAPSTVTPA